MLINSQYEFVTKWEFAAPQAQVWQQLNAPESWPLWWRGVEQVELLNKGTDELGHGGVQQVHLAQPTAVSADVPDADNTSRALLSD